MASGRRVWKLRAPQRWGNSVTGYAEDLLIGKLGFVCFFFSDHVMPDLSSPARDRTEVPSSGSTES